MARVRHLIVGLASSTALYSGLVPALGLGDITLHSALNQPFEAEIELLQVGDLESGDMRIGLASADIFSRSGVERFYFLNDLRFTPVLRGSQSVIRVVSSRPVREPYLNFIVEVARPGGQILREYTVLLDPPGSSAYVPVASIAQPSRAQALVPSALTIAPTIAPPAARLELRHPVAAGDSLWLIARRLREQGSELSQQALMDAIHALNPDAFVAGDRNRLLTGRALLLPDAARPRSADPVPAVGAVETAPVADVTPEQPAVAAVAPSQADELQLLQDRQSRLDQELASQSAENLQLQQGLALLQVQLQQLQEQLALKDAQLAQLSSQVAAAAPPLGREISTEHAAPRPAAATETASSHLWWTGSAGLLLLLGALAWAARRRAKGQPEPRQGGAPVEQVMAHSRAPLTSVPLPAPVEALPLKPAAADEHLEAVSVYIAYGRFSEARGLLEGALAEQPQRTDLRLRLLEVLAAQGDAAALAREQALLLAEGVDPAQMAVLTIGAQARPQNPANEVLGEPAQETADIDFQLNLDDLSLDADWDLLDPFPAVSREKPAVALADEADEPFASNLRELPLVLELNEASHDSAVFNAMRSAPGQDEPLDEVFLDAFASAADSAPLAAQDIGQLASDPGNLAKLNQALAYIEQGDLSGACAILNEVIDQGDDQQKQAARQLLAEIA